MTHIQYPQIQDKHSGLWGILKLYWKKRSKNALLEKLICKSSVREKVVDFVLRNVPVAFLPDLEPPH